MARQLRKFSYDKFIHIYNKFNPEISLPKRYLAGIRSIILESKKKFKINITHYHISNNHFHLVMIFKKEDKVNISKYMQWLGTKLAIFVNKVLKRHGKVFYDRFKSKIVETKRYLVNLFRYVVNNSLKHLGVRPQGWEYSSYHYYHNKTPDKIITHFKRLLC